MTHFESWLLTYLLNSVWQIPVLFAAAWIMTRALRSAGPLVEHRIWVGAYLLQSLLPACSAPWFVLLRKLSLWPHRAGLTGSEHVSIELGAGVSSGSLHLSSGLLSAIAILYATVVAYFVVRFVWRGRALYALRRRAATLTLSGESSLCWKQCSRSFGVTNANLAASSEIFGPITVGFRKGIVLLPAAMVSSLSKEDLHTVLAHEFAHMRRQDFIKNLIYEGITLPAKYHPLLWFTRERVIETREMVCDRMAAGGEEREEEYARSLLRLASLLVEGADVRTPHAIGIFDANAFERRLMKLTEKQPEIRGLRRVVIMTAVFAFGVATCCSALALHIRVGTGSASSEAKSPDSGKAVKIPSGVMAGSLLTHVNPVYPATARKAKIQGSVVLHAVIGKDGSIENLQTISGPEELRRSATDAVRQWTYKPYLLNGEPVEVETMIQVTYSMTD